MCSVSQPKNHGNHGGPAFPNERGAPGMSLRDWFAGRFAASLLHGADWDSPLAEDAKGVAKTAYRWADAMIAASKQ